MKIFFALGMLATFLGACKDDSVTVVTLPSASASASAVPVDHLANGELLEGTAQAFGLKIPRVMHIDAAFGDVVYASGQVPSDSVADTFALACAKEK